MRLHRLTVTAFGPFSGSVDIDFDEVSSAGLFLIRGATGAGKTSILDAVCFALYAAVPGARPGGRSLRSDHAPRDAVPTVTLEFTASGRRFRVERSPEFLRPKKRGGGETKSPARVVLHEQVGGAWVGRDTRHDDVAAVITEVLGMGLEQFSKVVLLPQGEFAAFLRATPEARREVLERLFDISSFAGVEDWLAGERRRTGEELAARRADLSSDLARLADALADVPPPVLDDPADWAALEPHEIPIRVAALHTALEGLAAETLAALDRATGAASAASARCHEAEQTLSLQRKGRAASDTLAALDARRGVHEDARAALALAARAAAVGGDLKAVERAVRALATAQDQTVATAAEIAGLGLEDRSPEGVEQWAELLRAHDDDLAQALRLSAAVIEKAHRRESLAAQARTAAQSAESLLEEAARAEQACRDADRVRAETAAAAASLDGLTARADAATSLLAVREEHDRGQVARAALLDRLTTARTHEQDVRSALLDLREARLNGMAGELAGDLVDGEPCPVCGSCAHPVRATRAQAVSAGDIEVAERRWEAARQALGSLERELVAADTAAAARTEQLGNDTRCAEELREAAAEARSAAAAARTLAGRAAAAEHACAQAEAARAATAERRERLRAEALKASATRDELARAVADDEAAVHDLLDSHARLCPCAGTDDSHRGATVVAARHAKVVAAADRHLAAQRQLQQAQQGHAEAADALAASLAEQGFADADEARASILPDSEVERLEVLCRDHDRARTQAETVLSDPDVAAAAAAEVPDLQGLRERVSAAHGALLEAKDAETLARRTLDAVARLRPALVEQSVAIGPAAARHALMRDLADTVGGTGGNNALRMRLSSFVLAARLERVAELANERLEVMGEGRYRLQHSDELARRGARSGLGLRVLDLWTGQTRDTSTLSGGEAFMASLALALGLADAVREEAGGFDLQTLFVDEGFGTLDDESLEQVMAVLDGLREGGRAVGVVSHVAELRTRIPCQIAVDKSESGSTVRVVGALHGEPAA